MNKRLVTPQQKRLTEYRELLEFVSRASLPWVCRLDTQIEKLLVLHGAAFLTAQFSRVVVARDGSKHIEEAVVTGLTPTGWSAVRSRGGRPLTL